MLGIKNNNIQEYLEYKQRVNAGKDKMFKHPLPMDAFELMMDVALSDKWPSGGLEAWGELVEIYKKALKWDADYIAEYNEHLQEYTDIDESDTELKNAKMLDMFVWQVGIQQEYSHKFHTPEHHNLHVELIRNLAKSHLKLTPEQCDDMLGLTEAEV